MGRGLQLQAKKAATRGKKRKPVSASDAEKLEDADDGAMPEAEKPSEDAEPQAKKKKNRRGPAGFALRGEGVEDTPEGRRARLKAAREAGAPTYSRPAISFKFPTLACISSRLVEKSLHMPALTSF